MHRRAFTIVELLAVVAMMAVLAAAVMVSMWGPARGARLENGIEQIQAYDRSTREVARRFSRNPVLRFNLNRGTVERIDETINDSTETTPLPLGDRMYVSRMMLAGGEVTSAGEVVVQFSTRGQCQTYAVQLTAPTGEQRWAVFAGLTGQVAVTVDEQHVQDILALASPTAP